MKIKEKGNEYKLSVMFCLSDGLIVFFLMLTYQENIKSFAEDSTELVHLKQIEYPPDETEGLASRVLPNVVKLEFKAHGQLVRLKLVKTSHIPTVTPFCIYENNDVVCLTEENPDQNYEFYHDTKNNAAVSIEIDHTTLHNGTLFKLNGEYMIGNTLFEIGSADEIPRRFTKKNYHYITRRSVSSSPIYAESLRHNKKKQYVVELLIMIDHSVYELFMEKSHNDTIECNKKIRYYFAHVANAIDLRFSTINVPDFSIFIRLSGYYILKNASSASFIINSLLSTPNGYKLNALSALNGLKEFLKTNPDQPSYDHAMLFTRYKIFNSEGRILGGTYTSGICSDLQLSIVVDHGIYTSARTAAHELAHNLGVTYHDGDGDASNCLSQLHYIMSPATDILNNTTKENAFRFSVCSIEQIRKKLKEMNSNNENCLVNTLSTNYSDEFLRHMGVLPGQLENVHDQCRRIYGLNSFMCPPNNPSEICYRMLCFLPSTRSCVAKSEQKAALGTPCGNKKWCYLGNCVENSNAPTAADDCPYPDLPSLANCSQAFPLLCKNKVFYQRCCDSCNKNFTAEDICKDRNLSGYTCPDFLKAYGTIQCQVSQEVEQFCCSSCKGLKNQTSIDSKPPPTISSNCTNQSNVKFNGLNCSQFISVYGNRMCNYTEIETTCCASCTGWSI